MHLVVGAGPVGSSVARELAERGERVRIVTRRGSGPEHPLIERIAADAADRPRLVELARGAEVVYNCVNPPYTTWERDWPPMSAALIAAARENDAVLAITSSLYGYGQRPGGHMDERTPLAATGRKGRVRITMWEDAQAAGIRTLEVRGSDYLGAGANGVFSMVLGPAIAKRRTAWVPADLDAPHSWTYVGDMARALVALARDERAWGRGWHAPTHTGISVRDLAARHRRVTGAPEIPLRSLPRYVMRTAGLVVPMAREMAEMDYQFYFPFLMDTTETDETFGVPRTDLDTILREVLPEMAQSSRPTPARRGSPPAPPAPTAVTPPK